MPVAGTRLAVAWLRLAVAPERLDKHFAALAAVPPLAEVQGGSHSAPVARLEAQPPLPAVVVAQGQPVAVVEVEVLPQSGSAALRAA